MNTRRAFLAAFAATAVLDPERLLWRPGARLISVPKVPRTVYATYVRGCCSIHEALADGHRMLGFIRGERVLVEARADSNQDIGVIDRWWKKPMYIATIPTYDRNWGTSPRIEKTEVLTYEPMIFASE